ncbi:MAG: magnesium protoporphyrin IX methyltransferase, partial [Myxococcota bacterium]
MMHTAGKLFPQSNRSPRIVPTAVAKLQRAVAETDGLRRFSWEGTDRVDSGFYISQGVHLFARESNR